jgi:hypothetical protein
VSATAPHAASPSTEESGVWHGKPPNCHDRVFVVWCAHEDKRTMAQGQCEHSGDRLYATPCGTRPWHTLQTARSILENPVMMMVPELGHERQCYGSVG